MRLRHSCLVAAVSGIGFVSAAQATLSVSLVHVPFVAGASADDAVLANPNSVPRTFELRVDQEAGEKWSFGTINMPLQGSATKKFYSPATGSDFSQESVWDTVGLRNLHEDTYLTSPDGGNGHGGAGAGGNQPSLTILGKSDYPANQTGPAVMPTSSNSADTIDVSWGDQTASLSTKGNGTYAIANITLMGFSKGTMVGHVGGTQHNFTDLSYSFNIPLPWISTMTGLRTPTTSRIFCSFWEARHIRV